MQLVCTRRRQGKQTAQKVRGITARVIEVRRLKICERTQGGLYRLWSLVSMEIRLAHSSRPGQEPRTILFACLLAFAGDAFGHILGIAGNSTQVRGSEGAPESKAQ